MIVRNEPTEEGKKLGKELSRLCDKSAEELKHLFPDEPLPERCASCAFRAGTFPNGCPETVLDAVKCVVENVPFHCHYDCLPDGTPTRICEGWAIIVAAGTTPPIKVAWEFSKGIEKEELNEALKEQKNAPAAA